MLSQGTSENRGGILHRLGSPVRTGLNLSPREGNGAQGRSPSHCQRDLHARILVEGRESHGLRTRLWRPQVPVPGPTKFAIKMQ